MEPNPYAPTKASLNEPVQGHGHTEVTDLELASRERRFVNSLIDGVGYMVLIFGVAVVISLVYPSFNELIAGPAGYLFQLAIFVLYYMPAELLTGRTPGKIITRTQVVSRDGGPPTAKQVLGRTLLRLVPLEGFTFLARGPGLHDRASGTRVVMTRNT